MAEELERIYKEIGKRIRALRLAAGYTSYETFAYDNDLPTVQYFKLETGKNATIKSLVKVLSIHQMDLEQFFSSDFYDRVEERRKKKSKK